MSGTASSHAGRLAERRRDLIVAAAQRVFAREGLARASMRAIAAEAGCTTGAIYPHFEGKEALYAAVLEASLTRLAIAVEEAARADPAPGAAALALFDYYDARPEEFSLGLHLWQGLAPSSLGRSRDRALNARLSEVFSRIEQGFAGAPDPAEEAAAAIALAAGALVLQRTGRMRLLGREARDLLRRRLGGAASGGGAPGPSA